MNIFEFTVLDSENLWQFCYKQLEFMTYVACGRPINVMFFASLVMLKLSEKKCFCACNSVNSKIFVR